MSVTADRASIPLIPGVVSLTRPHCLRLSISVGICAVIWFIALSGYMGVTPGSVITKRQNVLFNSDSGLWLQRIIGDSKSPEQIVHPLELILWRGPSRLLQKVLEGFLPHDYAGVLAARMLVAVIAGTGVAFLMFLAAHNNVRRVDCILLFTIYLLFTSNATMALPEHFAISNGLLTIAFLVSIVATSARLRTIVLTALTVLCGGTTITNAAYPAISLLHSSVKSIRTKLAVGLAGACVAGPISLFLFKRSWTVHWFVTQYWDSSALHSPVRIIVFFIFAIIAPAVGPTPLVMRAPGWDMVSYQPAHEPLHLAYYIGPQGFGAIAWTVLLFTCVWRAFKDERTRNYMWLPAGWVLFNSVFHNAWGDELFLYAPHWSWALMGMIILGARDLPRYFIRLLFAPIVISQLYTLYLIRNGLQTITQ